MQAAGAGLEIRPPGLACLWQLGYARQAKKFTRLIAEKIRFRMEAIPGDKAPEIGRMSLTKKDGRGPTEGQFLSAC